MKRTFGLGLVLLPAVWALVEIYDRLPAYHGVIVFGAMAGVVTGIACDCGRNQSEPGTR